MSAGQAIVLVIVCSMLAGAVIGYVLHAAVERWLR